MQGFDKLALQKNIEQHLEQQSFNLYNFINQY
jgi:hypothetical protein